MQTMTFVLRALTESSTAACDSMSTAALTANDRLLPISSLLIIATVCQTGALHVWLRAGNTPLSCVRGCTSRVLAHHVFDTDVHCKHFIAVVMFNVSQQKSDLEFEIEQCIQERAKESLEDLLGNEAIGAASLRFSVIQSSKLDSS